MKDEFEMRHKILMECFKVSRGSGVSGNQIHQNQIYQKIPKSWMEEMQNSIGILNSSIEKVALS